MTPWIWLLVFLCLSHARHRPCLFYTTITQLRCRVQAPAARPRYARVMCGRARLSSDVSEIELRVLDPAALANAERRAELEPGRPQAGSGSPLRNRRGASAA